MAKKRKSIPKDERDRLKAARGKKCERCHQSEIVHIHHVNGDPSDNNRENLLLLCPNCHVAIHMFDPTPHFDDYSNLFGGRILSDDEVRELERKPHLWTHIINFDFASSGFGVVVL